MSPLSIGEIAQRTGIAVDTIRYYEREGLLVAPPRAQSGYRQYTPDAIARLRFIRHAKTLGFSLREIRDLLSLRIAPGTNCAEVQRQAQGKIADVERRIADLEEIKRALSVLCAACADKDATGACPILDALEQESIR